MNDDNINKYIDIKDKHIPTPKKNMYEFLTNPVYDADGRLIEPARYLDAEPNTIDISQDTKNIEDISDRNWKEHKRKKVLEQELFQSSLAKKTLADYPDVMEAVLRAGSAIVQEKERSGETYDPEERTERILVEALGILGGAHQRKESWQTTAEKNAINELDTHIRGGRR